jgi:hypothetical protein
MAKILTTAIVADIRNKLNGSVFSKNRYGSYVRTKVTPVNPQTTAQQNARNILATNSQAWRDLSEADRQGWISAAANFPFTDIFGNSKTLSGSALFVKLNNNLAAAGQALISGAPGPIAIPALTLGAFTAVSATGVVSLAFADTPVPADFTLVIQTTGNVTPGKSFVKNLFRFVANKAAAAASPAVITSEFDAVHGAPVENQKIFARAFLVSNLTGQAGIPVQAMCIVS